MLFYKNLEEIPSPRCDGISRAMPDKSRSSEPIVGAKQTVAAEAAPRKLYTIVKYGDPVLEKATPVIQKFDAELEQLAEDMFGTMYAAQGVGLAAPQIGKNLRL